MVGKGKGGGTEGKWFVPLGHRFMFRGGGQAVFLRSLLRHHVLEWVGKKTVFLCVAEGKSRQEWAWTG